MWISLHPALSNGPNRKEDVQISGAVFAEEGCFRVGLSARVSDGEIGQVLEVRPSLNLAVSVLVRLMLLPLTSSEAESAVRRSVWQIVGVR